MESIEEMDEETPEAIEASSDPYLTVQERRIKCPECKRFSAETEEKMLRHIRKVHRGENPFQCSMCDYSTYNKAVFEEHVRIHQGIKPFKCSHCDYRSASKKNTKKHEQVHRPDNPLKCKKCNFIARHLKSLARHKLKNCTLTKKLTRDNKIAIEIPPMQDGGGLNGGKKCAGCNAIVPAENFEKHKADCKGGKIILKKRKYQINKDKKNQNKFVCATCSWTGAGKCRILLHLIHHPNQQVNEDLVDVQILRNFGIMK